MKFFIYSLNIFFYINEKTIMYLDLLYCNYSVRKKKRKRTCCLFFPLLSSCRALGFVPPKSWSWIKVMSVNYYFGYVPWQE